MESNLESRSPGFRGRPFLLGRVLQASIGFGLGALSLLFIGPETKRMDASVSLLQQVPAVMVVAGAYLAIALVARVDIRWSSILAICLALPSTPVFAILWLMSGWSTPSAEAARPFFFYIGGNIVLFLSALWVLIYVWNARGWRNTR